MKLPVTCIEGTYFQIYTHHALNITTIKCDRSSSIQLENHGTGDDGYIKIAVRFKSLQLPPAIVLYFDYTSKITVFSQYYIVATVKGQTNCWQSSYFSEGGYYEDIHDKLNQIYTRTEQQTTINALLGLPSTSEKYINKSSGELYLARGHLAANCDFVYEAQQKATYYYVNAVPQWQSFNNGNWKKMESDLRSYAGRNGLHLFVVAGTFGVLELPHERTHKLTKLYLSTRSPGRKVVPVPKFMFKLAFDLKGARGAVFIGMNNPYQSHVEFICADKSDRMRWLKWDKGNGTKGFSYACEISDFKRVVRDLPFDLKATGGLLT